MRGAWMGYGMGTAWRGAAGGCGEGRQTWGDGKGDGGAGGGWGMAQREVFTGEGVHTKLARKAFQLRRSRGLHGSCDGTAG